MLLRSKNHEQGERLPPGRPLRGGLWTSLAADLRSVWRLAHSLTLRAPYPLLIKTIPEDKTKETLLADLRTHDEGDL